MVKTSAYYARIFKVTKSKIEMTIRRNRKTATESTKFDVTQSAQTIHKAVTTSI